MTTARLDPFGMYPTAKRTKYVWPHLPLTEKAPMLEYTLNKYVPMLALTIVAVFLVACWYYLPVK